MQNVSSSNSEKALVPKLRFPEFTDAWEMNLFKELFTFLGNNTLSRAELSDKGSIMNIHYGDILTKFNNVINTNTDILPFIKNNDKIKTNMLLQSGDIIIADTAEDNTVGKSIELFSNENAKVVSGLHTIPCRTQKSFHPKYLGYYLNSPHFHNQLIPLMQGIKVLSISKQSILSTKISFPCKNEQSKISEILSLIDKKIQLQQQLIENLKLYKRGVVKGIFYKTTQYKKLNDLCVYKSSNNTYSNISKTKGDYPVYDATGIIKYIDCFDINKNYISIIKDGAGVGRLQFCQPNSSIIGTMGAIIPKKCDPYYLYYALQTVDFRKYIIGSTIPHIYFKDYSSVNIPYMNYNEQKKISIILYNLDNIIDKNIYIFSIIIKLKNGLLQQLFI